jgi:hypothetical protein
MDTNVYGKNSVFGDGPLTASPFRRIPNLFTTLNKRLRFNNNNRFFHDGHHYNRFVDWRTLFEKRNFGDADINGFQDMNSPLRSYYQNWSDRFWPLKKNSRK